MRKVFVEFEVTGRNLPLLLQKINLKKIPFKNLYKTEKGYRLSVEKKYRKDLINILNQSWEYKILSLDDKESKDRIFRSIGFIIGVIIFLLGTAFSSDYLISIKYCGDYAYFHKDIQEVLEDNSIKKYSRFSNIDCLDISEQIYAKNPLICYSSVKKSGNILIVEVKKGQDYTVIDNTKKELVSAVDGKILELKVYRGVALKRVGDEVKRGEAIVSGQRVEEDKVYQGFVLASATIVSCYSYKEKGENSPENIAKVKLRAKALCGKEDYYFETASCEKGEILVKLYYLTVIGG